MARKNEFVNYLLELLQPFGNVGARAMFGGHGIYKDGLIFGIVVDDTFYLKADDLTRAEFDEQGLVAFVYESKGKGKQVSLGYYQCPVDALESATVMLDWATRAFGAALRAAARKNSVKQRITNGSAKVTSTKRPAKHKAA